MFSACLVDYCEFVLVRGILLDLFSLFHFIFLFPLVSQAISTVDFPLRTLHLEDEISPEDGEFLTGKARE